MSTYAFDPTGQALQNHVLGETKTLNLPAGHDYLFVVPTYGPFFEDSLVIKYTDTLGNARILEPFVDYHPGFQFVEATSKTNRALYGGFSFIDITLTGTVTYSYQALGGDYELSTAQITAIQANEARDPQFTSWEAVLQAQSITLVTVPTIDHPWSRINVETIKKATDELEEAGLVVHLRPKFLPNPGEAEYIPSKAEIGLGNVDNYRTATNTEAITGTASDRFMTPASTKAMLQPQVATYLTQIGYKVPVPYVAGLVMDDIQDTVSYQDNVYAPRQSAIPFTTNGSFEKAKFLLVHSNTRSHWNDPISFTVTGNEPEALTGAKLFNTNQSFSARIESKLVLNNVIDLVYKTDYQLDDGQILVEYPLKAGDVLEFTTRDLSSRMPRDRDYYKLITVTSGVTTFTLPEMDAVVADDLRITLNDFVILSKETDYTITGDQLTITYPLRLNDTIEVENIDTIPFLGKQPMREILQDVESEDRDAELEVIKQAVKYNSDELGKVKQSVEEKQTQIAPGTAEQYYRGDKSWSHLATDVRNTVLTGLSTASGALVAAADSIVAAIGKLQRQISDTLSNLASTATGKGAALVGWKQTGNEAVARTVDDKLKEFVSVKDFGAVGDGVTDDTAAIQAAIDSFDFDTLKPTGGIVFFPRGHYKITDTITLKSGINLYGESRRSVRIYAHITNGNIAIHRPVPVTDTYGSSYWAISISNMRIIGYGTDGNGTGTGHGVFIADSNQVCLDKVDIVNFISGSGLVVRSGAFQSIYRDIEITNCRVGLDITGADNVPNRITTIFFYDIIAQNCSKYACSIYTTFDCGFYNCTFQSTGNPAGTPATDEECGVFVQKSDFISFHHCHFERNRAEGLLIKNSRGIQDHDSSFSSSGFLGGSIGTEDSTKPHVRYGTGSVRCSLNNSCFYTKNGNMIHVDAEAIYTNIMFPIATTGTSPDAATSVDVTLTNNGTHTHFARFRQSDNVMLFGPSNGIIKFPETHIESQNGLQMPGGDGSQYQFRVDANKKPYIRRASDGISRATGDIHYGGGSGNRPASPLLYESYYDTTLGKPIWWLGTDWKDATGTTV